MSIRIRTVDGVVIALCAVESDPKAGDLYLDDAHHEALAAKFAEDWSDYIPWGDVGRVALMEKEKLRDAKEEINRWVYNQFMRVR